MLNWDTITRTQRNWNYDKPVSDEDARLIVDRVRSTLTKQNIPYYDVYYTVNPEHIQAIFEISKLESNTQGQLQAPMLVWFAHDKDYARNYIDSGGNNYGESKLISLGDKKQKYMYFSFGLAVAWTITAAVDLGYRAGASQCFDNEKLVKYLNDNTPYTFGDHNKLSEVMIGIGHPSNNPRLEKHYALLDEKGIKRYCHGFPNVKRKFEV